MKRKDKKAFTLIELIVTIAVLGVLVLLASPRFFGHTQNAELTKGFANARSIEKASELYYMDYEDWPRLTDDPYTSEEIKSYSERIFDRTGQEVNLNPDGNYYDIDYDKLSDYIQVPDDKRNYILQNPVGKVFYMDNLNETGIARVNYSSTREEDDNPTEEGLMTPIEPREPIAGEIAIDSADELAKIGTSSEYLLNRKYILTANIDLSNIDWTPIGTDSSSFKGSFDGNGYSITGLTINRSTTDYVGLFGYTEGATIENVSLEDINVTGRNNVGGLVGYASSSYYNPRATINNSYAKGTVTGRSYVGGLVGYANNSSGSTEISDSYATGSVKGSSQVGGLVGLVRRSTIENSYATGQVTGSGNQVGGLVGSASSVEGTYSTTMISNSYATGTVTGKDGVGGLVGKAYLNTIENSYATGPVTGSGNYVGGLVGSVQSSSSISNSYATGSVEGTGNYVGGLVGEASYSTIRNSYATGSVTGGNYYVGGLAGSRSGGTISNSYWNTKTTGQPTSAGGEGKSTEEMKKKATYRDSRNSWDFENVWKIDEDRDYPKLR